MSYERKISKITLGTAQLGFPYGIANETGEISSIKAEEILKAATNMGINCLDTAPNYGKSEQVIGDFIKNSGKKSITIMTKIPKIILENNGKFSKSVYDFINKSVKKSCKNLGIEKIPICLLHNPADMDSFDGDVVSGLNQLKEEEKIQLSGVSVYTIKEVKKFLDLNDFDVIQIPINIFNSKIVNTDLLTDLKKNKKIVFARSIYLQGLFFLNPEKIPKHLEKAKSKLSYLHKLSKEYSRNIEEIAFTFVRDISEIDSMIIGVESINQLRSNVKLMDSSPLSEEMRNKIYREFNNISEEIVNPSLWNK